MSYGAGIYHTPKHKKTLQMGYTMSKSKYMHQTNFGKLIFYINNIFMKYQIEVVFLTY